MPFVKTAEFDEAMQIVLDQGTEKPKFGVSTRDMSKITEKYPEMIVYFIHGTKYEHGTINAVNDAASWVFSEVIRLRARNGKETEAKYA